MVEIRRYLAAAIQQIGSADWAPIVVGQFGGITFCLLYDPVGIRIHPAEAVRQVRVDIHAEICLAVGWK